MVMAVQRAIVVSLLLVLFCSKYRCEEGNQANDTELNMQERIEFLEERLKTVEAKVTENAQTNKLGFARLANAFGALKARKNMDFTKELKSLASRINEQDWNLMNLTQKLQGLDGSLQKMKERNSGPTVAFKAKTPKDSTPENNQRIVYTRTILNEGNCFDNVTGMCTAPVDGIYLLTVHFCTVSGVTMNYNIVVDDAEQLVGYAYDANGVSCHSPSVLVKMAAKQRAWVKSRSTPGNVLTWSSSYWNMFSGTLIYRMNGQD